MNEMNESISLIGKYKLTFIRNDIHEIFNERNEKINERHEKING